MPEPKLPRAHARGFLGMRPGFALWAGAVVVLALLVREYFVLVAIVDIPIRGDIREYVAYAWNLYNHAVFSVAPPQEVAPVPDAYRSPGYPWLLALCMSLRPQGTDWYALALQLQVVLGTMTVWLAMLVARRWLNQGWAIAAGLLLAVWPHHVAASGALLSEVAFGLALMAGLYCLSRALDGQRHAFLGLAALVFAYAYLVNPLIALFPPAIALLVWQKRGRGAALVFAGIFLLPLLIFGMRNAQLDDDPAADRQRPGRAVLNFVQGSWPQYHWAWHAQKRGNPAGVAITQEINREAGLLEQDAQAGLAAIATRMASDPGYYAAWYLWRKPSLLWDWDIRIGPGGIYVLEVRDSPLQTHPLLRWSATALRVLNPLLSLLALGGMLSLLAGGIGRKPWAPATALATALLALYLTAIHTVFQAEPRYATAYRGIEILLVMTMLKLLADAVRRPMANPGHARLPSGPT